MSNKNDQWKEQLHLTVDEAKTCRFECFDTSMRLFSCTTHEGRHGLRLHPIHKFEVIDGVVYKRVDDTLKVWYDYLYDKENRGDNDNGRSTDNDR